ncbi:MAG: beta-L-arabinofuranosidase domain-containing protein, partial [Planctomycetota bacterium]
RRAGRPAHGVELGGWYSRDNGNIFGQVLSALARAYAVTEDDALRDKVAALVGEWGRCLGPDGYGFYAQPTGVVYTFDKLVGGLVDTYLYAAVDEARPLLARFVDWGIRNLDRTRLYANADGEGAANVAGAEWYTLPENLYRAFLATGDQKYRDFAEIWEYPEFWNQIAAGADIFAPRPDGRTPTYHAYSHANSFSSAAAAYLVTHDRRYLDVLRAAFDFLWKQTFATGGYGPRELLLPPARLPAMLAESKYHYETQCGTWAAFKLCKYLLQFTGDARCGDWIERLLYNAVLASLPITDDGRVFYYSSYQLDGGFKEHYDDGWACCAGTYPLVSTDLHDLIYLRPAAEGDGGLYVNLYVPATVDWQSGDTFVSLAQHTRFPEDDTVDFSIFAARAVRFALRLRVPGWLAGPLRVEINGEPWPADAALRTVSSAPADAQRWLTIDRKWTSADTLSVQFPQRLAAQPLLPDKPLGDPSLPPPGNPAALTRGPVVLAIRAPEAPPHGRIHLADLDHELLPADAEPLTYHVRNEPELLVRPFYAFRAKEPYFMYLH